MTRARPVRLPSLSNVEEPLYVRLKMALRDLIGGGLRPGDRLPSENELCRHYDLSRITVRLALAALEAEGVIRRQKGKGTFVAPPKLAEPIDCFRSFGEEMAADAGTGAIRIVSFERLMPDARVGERLATERGERVYKIRRVKTADGRPICYQVSYLPTSLYPSLDRAAISNRSLRLSLSARSGDRMGEADEAIEMLQADPYRAKLLGVPLGAPLLVLERLVHSRRGRPVEFTRSFYHAERVRLQLRPRPIGEESAPDGIELRDIDTGVIVHD